MSVSIYDLDKLYEECALGDELPDAMIVNGYAILSVDPTASVVPDDLYLVTADGIQRIEYVQ